MVLSSKIRVTLAIAAGVLTLLTFSAYAHVVTYHAHLDATDTGSGSSAHGTMSMQADEHSNVFDVLTFTVHGIDPATLDNTHGPNMTAIHVHMGEHDHGGGDHTLSDHDHDPIVIDLGWYISAGFGTLTPTADGFVIVISGILTEVQGLYNMTAETGMTPHDVFHAMEEGAAYVQIHTQAHPDGEIRGQLHPETETATESRSWGRVKSRFSETD